MLAPFARLGCFLLVILVHARIEPHKRKLVKALDTRLCNVYSALKSGGNSEPHELQEISDQRRSVGGY